MRKSKAAMASGLSPISLTLKSGGKRSGISEPLAPANPATERHPAESLCIGLMLLAYGELELMVGNCLGHALGSNDAALRTMFRIMGETSRIEAADALMRDYYKKEGFEAAYSDMIGAVRYCVTLRNQYAHCHWADYPDYDGLFFTKLQEPARTSESFQYWFLHVDLKILNEQKKFFDYAGACLRFLEYRNLVKTGRMPDGVVPAPRKLKHRSCITLQRNISLRG
jgi:hypothetical protein